MRTVLVRLLNLGTLESLVFFLFFSLSWCFFFFFGFQLLCKKSKESLEQLLVERCFVSWDIVDTFEEKQKYKKNEFIRVNS